MIVLWLFNFSPVFQSFPDLWFFQFFSISIFCWIFVKIGYMLKFVKVCLHWFLIFLGWRSYSDGGCDRFGRRCDARDPGGRRLCHRFVYILIYKSAVCLHIICSFRFVHQTHSNCWPQHYQLHSDTFKRTGNRNSTRTIPGNCQSH